MPSKKKKYNSRFPPARIKKIMQTDEDIGKVAAAVPVLISKCLEMFLVSLLSQSGDVTRGRKAKTMSTSHIKQCILEEQKFDFLKELVESIPDVQNEEESGFNDEEQKKIFRKRSLPRPKKEAKKRTRLVGSTEESDSSDDHEQTSEDNQNSLLSPPISLSNNSAESCSGSMQFHIPIDNIIAASKLLSESSTSEAEQSDTNHTLSNSAGPSKIKTEVKPDQHRRGVIVKNLGVTLPSTSSVSTKKEKKVEISEASSYTPITVPLHLSPQLPNPDGPPVVQPGGMLNFLYSGLAVPPPPMAAMTTTQQPYMYTPLTQSMSKNNQQNAVKDYSALPPYFSFPAKYQNDTNQAAHSSSQRHYLGYPQAILTPPSHAPDIGKNNNHHHFAKPTAQVQPAKRNSEDDDNYDE